MFTGVIEDLGRVVSLERVRQGAVLTVRTAMPVGKIAIGESIAFNGVCMTVTKKGRNTLGVDVAAETLRRSTIGTLAAGDRVNLERCLTLEKMLSGHLVAGHVDGVGRIVAIKPEGGSRLYSFSAAPAQARYLVEKGSVAIDGISLTVFSIRGNQFSVALIPHTLKVTTLGYKRVGAQVNIESDMMAKYVERMLDARGESERAAAP